MQARLLACLPIATLLMAALLLPASSFVAVFESRLIGALGPPAQLVRGAPPCLEAARRIDAIVRRVSRCRVEARCLASPLLCPVELGAEAQHELRALEDLVETQCGGSFETGLGALPNGLIEMTGCGEPPGEASEASDPAGPDIFQF